MMMNKIIGLAVVVLLCLGSCTRDNDTIYYPVGNVNVENGGSATGRWRGRIGCPEL